MTKKSTIEGTKLYKAMFEACSEAIIVVNDKMEIITANPSAIKLFGYTEKQMIGKAVDDLVPQRYHATHRSHQKAYFNDPQVRPMGKERELFAVRKDGKEVPVEISLSPSEIDGQRVVIAFIIDISHKVDIEDSVIENQEKLKAIINAAVDGIITIDTRGSIESVNPAAAKLFGYRAKELIGKNISTLMPSPYQDDHDTYLNNYQKSHEPRIIGIGREVVGLKKDGSTFPFHLSVSEVKLKSRTVYTGIVHDITEEKKAKEHLRKLNKELEKRVGERTKELADLVNKLESANEELKIAEVEVRKSLEREKELNELKSRFVSMASHEFRTPLSTILSSAALVEKYTQPEQEERKQKHLSRIKGSVKNLTGILNDFLSIDKLEAGKIVANPSEENIKELSRNVIEDLESLLKTGQKIDYKHKGKDTAEVDANLMKNILINLLSNAIKYSSENKEITFNTEHTGKKLKVHVKDKGIGIPENEQHNMFDRFFRAKNVTNIQGTGLGLNIVKKYVELMGGKITFVSKLEEGTTFKIEIPQ